MNKKSLILGIETSCDDTSMAIIEKAATGSCLPPKILAHHSFNQEKLLKRWGGVVPEIAARNHMEMITPIFTQVLASANLKIEDVVKEISLIGVTALPGLLGPLLTGINLAKTLSLLLKLPIVPVNHLYAHLEAIWLTEDAYKRNLSYPYLGLLVSGGHSIYFLVQGRNCFELLGQTIDDAAGEAFDKGGRLLGLPYPAGKIIDDLSRRGDPTRFAFPIGLQAEKSCNLSYSGLKTSLKTFLVQHPQIIDLENPSQELCDLCASYQMAIIRALLLKMDYALAKAGAGALPIVVGGGVAANRTLREEVIKKYALKGRHQVFVVPFEYCTDNGAMIANYAGLHEDEALAYPQSLMIDAKARLQ
ncbi:MAG: tRNA (adenosine(37)-N6)-threonylcarbamoyltransferase complex transferase subunit TsaD [Oligoflexia bacterium]|nr:tRNA (adenosine(37)-N6)-threonylcarbamoyltransferase complex transferase subunit TsaD [Oligoflexia bacterium]MBF0363920.1 tRNA (adenosine(37)-N6)-threonylcarbamoyltransferase complex transferase subunit TsaD [Oligoflexia bacterium]